MDKLEVIIKSYCEIMILLEYGDEKARDNVLYENLKIDRKRLLKENMFKRNLMAKKEMEAIFEE